MLYFCRLRRMFISVMEKGLTVTVQEYKQCLSLAHKILQLRPHILKMPQYKILKKIL